MTRGMFFKGLAITPLALCIGALFWHAGRVNGQNTANRWWLNRITGKEFPVESSVLRKNHEEVVYCVLVKDYGHDGFVAQPAPCGGHSSLYLYSWEKERDGRLVACTEVDKPSGIQTCFFIGR